jgi:beta-lactamase class A
VRTIVILVIALVISLFGNIYQFSIDQNAVSEKNFNQLENKYSFLSKETLQRYQNNLINNFLPLRQELDKKIMPYQNDFAMYFEYIPTGVSIGMNEDAEFTPASLLKVPVTMAYFHKKERLGLKEDPVVTLTEKELDNSFGDLYKKGAGTQLSLGEAVKAALQQSDNTASLALASYIEDDDYRFIDEGLDIPLTLHGETPIITAQQYSSILKALYFSSLLNRDNSQYILDLLTKTDFNNMLPSGVPADVQVAHKIGLIDNQIYNDCGIVYVPNRPYILCMISKSNRTVAQERMKDISQTIYEYVVNYKVPTL